MENEKIIFTSATFVNKGSINGLKPILILHQLPPILDKFDYFVIIVLFLIQFWLSYTYKEHFYSSSTAVLRWKKNPTVIIS